MSQLMARPKAPQTENTFSTGNAAEKTAQSTAQLRWGRRHRWQEPGFSPEDFSLAGFIPEVAASLELAGPIPSSPALIARIDALS